MLEHFMLLFNLYLFTTIADKDGVEGELQHIWHDSRTFLEESFYGIYPNLDAQSNLDHSKRARGFFRKSHIS